ncbi:MAG TPA: PAS domain S-box protein [Thermoanaerobaculia bacterium]|nr:PAS domain S-box protein [Thermoanaerobaculia bacterium]
MEQRPAGAVVGSSDERYRDLVENSNELIWSADAFGRWTFVNAAARRIYGCTPEEMIGRPMTDWMVPGDSARDLRALERILEGERYVQHETRHRRKDGTLVTLAFKTTAVRDARGNLLGTTGIASDVTGHREIEEARRTSEARFRHHFERSLAGVYRTTRSGRIIDGNASLARMLGFASREEARGHNLRDFYADPAARDAFLARLAEPGAQASAEVRLRRRDGAAVWVLESASRIEEGTPPEIVIEGTLIDVTDRRRAVDALKESEEYFRSLIDNAADVIMIVDSDGRIRFGSPSVEKLLGYRPQEIVAERLLDAIHPEDAETVRRMFAAMVHGSGSASAEFRFRHRDGSWRHMEAVGSDLSHHPSVAGLLVQLRDVTERKAADENQARLQFAIQDAAKEWQRTFDAIESPVLVLDGNACIRRLNRAAKVLSGKSYRETIGLAIEGLGPGEPWQKSAELAHAVRAGGSAISGQARDVANGRTWDVGASLLRAASSESERIILVAREITGVVRLQEKLHHTRTMSAMGSLVAGVAHEVRNPLFGISATLDAFEARFGQRSAAAGERRVDDRAEGTEGRASKEDYQQYVAVLRGELERLSHLMGDLLEYGKPTSLEFSDGALADVVAEAVQGSRTLADTARVALRNTVDGGLPRLRMDRRRLLQVFQNLLDNAVRHSPPKSAVVVEAERSVVDGETWVDCRVLDEGPGFRLEDLPRVFEPFFTRRRGGTGLGLSIVQRIVEDHGGRIVAGNRPEGGAAMTVRLPAAESGPRSRG